MYKNNNPKNILVKEVISLVSILPAAFFFHEHSVGKGDHANEDKHCLFHCFSVWPTIHCLCARENLCYAMGFL